MGVIHVVGPGFRSGIWDNSSAMSALSAAYTQTFIEFAGSSKRVLRLLPISGGIFVGQFHGVFPQITMGALVSGYSALNAEHRALISTTATAELLQKPHAQRTRAHFTPQHWLLCHLGFY